MVSVSTDIIDTYDEDHLPDVFSLVSAGFVAASVGSASGSVLSSVSGCMLMHLDAVDSTNGCSSLFVQ